MKKLILWLVFLFGALGMQAQFTTVSGNLTDGSGNVWQGATINASFKPTPNFTGKYNWNGQQFSNFADVTTTTDSSGNFSFNVPSSSAITPAGSTWYFSMCPLISIPCQQSTAISITGGSMNVTSFLAPFINNPKIDPTPIQQAYNDAQVGAAPGQGQFYWNSTLKVPRYWDGTKWVSVGNGSGQAIFCAGASCANGAQLNVPFTTTANLTPTAGITTTSTSVPVVSTAGYPPVGCGFFQVNSSQEYFCWSSIDATDLLGLTRGYYGTAPQNWPFPTPGFSISGIANSSSVSPNAPPSSVLFNNTTYVFPTTVSISNINVSGQSVLGNPILSTTLVRAISIGNPSAGIGSFPLEFGGESWNGASVNSFLRLYTVLGVGANPRTTLNMDRIGDTGQVIVSFPNLTLQSTTLPCDSTTPGNFNFIAGGAGVKDTVQVCAKDASNNYAYRTIY